jgi:hypothetical protein
MSKAANEAIERAIEQARQEPINKLIQDGQRLMLSLLAFLLKACAGQLTILPAASQPVKKAVIPTQPLQARQLLAPQWCLPMCSSALMREREIWWAIQSHVRGIICEQSYDSVSKSY